MVTQLEVSEALVKLPKLLTELETLFRSAHPSREERDTAVILAIDLHKYANIVASWALKS